MKSRDLKSVSRTLRSKQTDAERHLWFQLRSHRFQGMKFRRQLPLAGFVVDFCSSKNKLVIELDGGQHTVEVDKDQQRTTRIEKEGYRVLRFWDHEVLKNMEAVLEKIRLELKKSPSPALFERTLSPRGRGNECNP